MKFIVDTEKEVLELLEPANAKELVKLIQNYDLWNYKIKSCNSCKKELPNFPIHRTPVINPFTDRDTRIGDFGLGRHSKDWSTDPGMIYTYKDSILSKMDEHEK